MNLLTEVCVDAHTGLSDVSERVCLSPSTSLRLLNTLSQEDFVTRDPEGFFQPGAQVVRPGALALAHDALISLAKPAMRHMVEPTGESCYPGIRSITDTAVYIAIVDGSHDIRHPRRTSMRPEDTLSVEALLTHARERTCPEASAEALRRLDDSAAAIRVIAATRPVYGRTTGVGANRSVTIDPGDSVQQDLRLLRSHATASGPTLPDDVVRAMLLVRMRQLLRGGSGLDSTVVTALAALLNSGDLPVVHAHGSIGTGDLSALAEVGLALCGELPLASGICRQLWSPTGGDALPFISSNALTSAQAGFAVDALDRWLAHHAFVTAASLVAVRGSGEPFTEEVQQARPHRMQAETAAAVRAALLDVELASARVQDSFGLRAMPQVVAPVYEASRSLREIVEVEINSSPENPLYDAELDVVRHHGNFHGQGLALAADHATLALAGAAQLSLARLNNLSDPTMTGQRAFLSDGQPGSSGIMMVEYVAAAAVSRLTGHATPASLSTTVISRGTEDHSGFSSTAVEQLHAALGEATTVLACEVVAARRGVLGADVRIPDHAPLARYLDFGGSGQDLADRPLTAEIDTAIRFLGTSGPLTRP